MNYAEKNNGFITSHKLKEFIRCPRCYELKFILMKEDPTEKDKDYFIVGQALDDLTTHGKQWYDEKYETVSRRGKSEKIQLTNVMSETVNKGFVEYSLNPMFPERLEKKIFSIELGGFRLRGELDGYDEKNFKIIDLKSTANIFTFEWSDYVFQMGFYALLAQEETGQQHTAELLVVDKNSAFARSRCYQFRHETLRDSFGVILQGLDKLRIAQSTGIYLPTSAPEDRERCVFYTDHGRRKEPIII